MEEHPYIPYTPPVPPKKSHKGLKRVSLVLLGLLFIGAVGYGVYAWKQNDDLQTNLSNEKSSSQSLLAENNKLKDELNTKPSTNTITETLPNGKTMTYPDTASNRNILWWSTGTSSSDDEDQMIILSHKGFQQYLSTLDSELITSVCGADSEVKAIKYNINVGIFDTNSKKLSAPQNSNCVEQLASTDNSDADSHASAKKVLDNIKSDVDQFIASVKIK